MTIPAVRRAVSSLPAVWLGRLGLAVPGAWSAILLVRDTLAIL